jgi:outer membrane autotransporter protein
VKSDFYSFDLRNNLGVVAAFNSESLYYCVHLGAGYVWNISEAASLDVYGKYFWTHQDGDSVKLSTGEPIDFKDVDSHRSRLGGRFSYACNDFVSPYVGAAWEYEFDGKAGATTYGHVIEAPKMRGSTGIGELGISIKPATTLPLSFDLGVQGYVGKREGVTGSLQVKWEF